MAYKHRGIWLTRYVRGAANHPVSLICTLWERHFGESLLGKPLLLSVVCGVAERWVVENDVSDTL